MTLRTKIFFELLALNVGIGVALPIRASEVSIHIINKAPVVRTLKTKNLMPAAAENEDGYKATIVDDIHGVWKDNKMTDALVPESKEKPGYYNIPPGSYTLKIESKKSGDIKFRFGLGESEWVYRVVELTAPPLSSGGPPGTPQLKHVEYQKSTQRPGSLYFNRKSTIEKDKIGADDDGMTVIDDKGNSFTIRN